MNGDGPYGPTSVTPTTAGTYYWIASYTGDLPNTKSATTACGDTGETSTLPPATPAISTTATAGPVVVTTALDDTAHLSGTVPEPGGVTPAKGTITFTLYGPELSTSVCSTTLATRVVNVSGNGDYVASSGSTGTGSLTPIVPGIYNWIAVYSGDLPNDPGVSTACGDANESTTVIPAWQPPPAPAAGTGAETQPILRAQTGAGPQAQLNIESGPDAGNNHQAGDAALRVGRSPDNDLILRDPATSGHHARVERRGQQFWIVDLGSTNGTLVNGEPIQEKELNHGDRITIGQNAVSFAIVEA